MTKKDYELIANLIFQSRPMPEDQDPTWMAGCNSAREFIARRFCEEAQRNNARFNRSRFLKACGIED